MKKLLLLILCLSLVSCDPDNQNHSLCSPQTEMDKSLYWLQDGEKSIPVFGEALGGQVFRGGDILIGEFDEVFSGHALIRGKPWNNNTVNFKIHPELPNKDRVYSAVKRWEKVLNGQIKFQEVTEAENYIEIVVGKGCWSYVGMIGGRQELGLDFTCTTGTATHEFGHALGLEHEHTRPDRDSYISVKWCNIQDDAKSSLLADPPGTPMFGKYDYLSLMHYGMFSFSKNLLPVLVSKTTTPVPLVSPKFPRLKDIKAVKCIHGDQAACSVPSI